MTPPSLIRIFCPPTQITSSKQRASSMASPTHQATYGSSWRMEGFGSPFPAAATLPPSPAAVTVRITQMPATPQAPPPHRTAVRPSWIDVFFSCGEGHAEGLDCPPTPRSQVGGRSSLVVSQQQQRLERDQHSSTSNSQAGAGDAGSYVLLRRAFEGLGFFGADVCSTL